MSSPSFVESGDQRLTSDEAAKSCVVGNLEEAAP